MRTLYNNLTGRAASTHKRETTEYVRSMEVKSIIDRLQHKQDQACLRCIELEGVTSFWDWYDNNDNIPPMGTYSDRIASIQARIAELESAARCAIVLRISDTPESIRLEG